MTASVDQGEARVVFVDCPGYEVDGLKEAVGTRRCETLAGELAGDILERPGDGPRYRCFGLRACRRREPTRATTIADRRVYHRREHAGEANAAKNWLQRLSQLSRASWVVLDEFQAVPRFRRQFLAGARAIGVFQGIRSAGATRTAFSRRSFFSTAGRCFGPGYRGSTT